MSSSATSHSSAMPGLPSQRGRRPEILLDKNCLIGSCQNSTSAIAANSEGLSVEVSFEIRDPPALSLCFASCHDLSGIQRLPREPDILSAAGALVLLAIPFSDDGGFNQLYMDYFVYRAGPGEVPSLHLLPRPYPPSCRHSNVAVMPIGDDSEHYAVVFPDWKYAGLVTHNHYADLHIYRSDRNAWCTQAAYLAEDTETRNATTTMKLALHRATSVVYAAGSGLVGWVDLWWGILLCNVLDENPTVRFIALPVPEPCQTHTKFEFEYLNPETHRHVRMHDGVMKFIELKYHQDAAFNAKRRDDRGWMATTWTRPVSSDAWHEGLTLDTSDISVADDSSFLQLLPEILGEDAWEKCSSGGPILSLHDDNMVYIVVVKRNLVDTVTIVLSLNTGSLTLESCAQCFGPMIEYFEPSYVPSVLSSYFGVTTSVLSYRDVKHPSKRSADTHLVLSPSAAPSKHRKNTPVKVFGPAMSPTVVRVLVCLEEVGAEYEVVNIDYETREHESPEHLARNPFGQIPAFQDGDLLLWESRAISKYVLRKYRTYQVDLLRAGNLEEAALVDVWTEVEAHTYNPPALSPVVYECLLNPLLRGTPTNHKVVAESLEKLKKVLEVYEARLSKHRYLAGDFVSFADISHFPYTFYFMSTPHAALFDSYPHVKVWWDRLMTRPAVKKIAATMVPPKP